MESISPRGYTVVLQNRHFLNLWMAQVISNTALNASFFIQIILIEHVTGSSAHLAAVILSFSLPAVMLSALAGLIVDRVPKKFILVGSNALRVATGAALALLAAFFPANKASEVFFLSAIYILVFLTSAIGQFFAPAEGAMIPLLVRSENLLPANSLFAITFNASQVLGLVILAPLGVKTLGIVGSFWTAAVMYVAATLLVTALPRDQPNRANAIDGISALRRAWNEIREGWHFAITHRAIFVALWQLALVSMLTMLMAMLAPGYATRVLGLSPEDATYVFWPAGVGVLFASIAIGRFGHSAPRELLTSTGMFALGAALIGLAWAGGGGVEALPLFRQHPELMLSTTAYIMIFSLLTGVAMAVVSIPAQTVVQECSHDGVRGRVLAVQFTLSNALGIPPMLFIGNLADIFGIPRITMSVAILIVLLAILNFAWVVWGRRLARAPSPDAPQPSSPDSTLTTQ